jgi:hypothetical protein
MKTDLRPGPADEPGSSLRLILRSWDVPGPPADLEEDLRRDFRQSRPRARRRVWLALAAGLGLLAVWQVIRRPSAPAPSPPASVVAEATQAPVFRATAPPRRTDVGPVEPAPSRRRATVPARRGVEPAEAAVVVEPSQRELLMALAESLRGARQAPVAVAPPPVAVEPAVAPERAVAELPEGAVPEHRDDWERVAGAWPFIHLSVPSTKR